MRVKGCWRGFTAKHSERVEIIPSHSCAPANSYLLLIFSRRISNKMKLSGETKCNIVFLHHQHQHQHRAAAARYSTRIMSMKARTAGSSNPVCSDEQCLYSSMKIANFALYTQTLRQPSKFHLELETPPLNTRKLKGTGGNIRYVDCIYNSSFELHFQHINKCFPDKKLIFEYRKLQYKY